MIQMTWVLLINMSFLMFTIVDQVVAFEVPPLIG